MTDEKAIYEQGTIKITNLRAVFGDKTYAMSNITSVEKGTKADNSGCVVAAMVLIGILMVVFSFSDGIQWGTLTGGLLLVTIYMSHLWSASKRRNAAGKNNRLGTSKSTITCGSSSPISFDICTFTTSSVYSVICKSVYSPKSTFSTCTIFLSMLISFFYMHHSTRLCNTFRTSEQSAHLLLPSVSGFLGNDYPQDRLRHIVRFRLPLEAL
jgi:hypothetical protein